MSFNPILPRLQDGEDNRIENFNKAGVWSPRRAVELERLSRSLKTEQLEFEINSIPDMWARPILFEMALLEPGHSLHNRIVGEWRGLLALIALKELRKFNLTVKPLEIKNEPGHNQGSDFLQILAKLKPTKKFAEDTPWDKLYVILFKGKPIGITSPVTLVCTSTYYYNFIHGVSWFDGRFLNDPVSLLNTNEKEALVYWLEQLKLSLTSHPGVDVGMDEFNKLIKAIDKFMINLGESRGTNYALSRSGLGIERGIFRYLDKPIGGDPRKISHVSIKPSVTGNVSPTLLVVDRNISQQWDMHEKDVILYGGIPMDGIPFGGLTGNRNIILGTQLEDAEWCVVADFFTKKLFVIDQKNAFPGIISSEGSEDLTFQDRPVTPIVPLTDILVRYLNPGDIARRLRFEQLKDLVKVFFHLPLLGPDGTGKDFVVSKEYNTKENDIVLLSNVPDLEVWPDFIITDWKVYYSYFLATGERGIQAEPYPENIVTDHREFKNKRGEVERKIHKLNRFPEAFICKIQLSDAQARQFVQYDAGLLLLKKPNPERGQRKSFKVGIDFGTSGTNVYFQEGNVEPAHIEFVDRFLQVTAPPSAKRTKLYDHFLPGQTETTPFLSVFHDFLISHHELSPLLDGHIYFLQDYKYFNAGGDGMMTDLKWGDKEERKRSLAFLKQLSLQCAAEIAVKGGGEVSWRFSYPSAFSSKDREAFTVIWEQIARETCDLTGLELTDQRPIPKSESIASAGYFAFEEDIRATLMRGAVFIDIGGATSDISIWQGEKKMLFQTSLRFAGRDIFSYLLWKKPDFMNHFDKEEKFASLNNEAVKRNFLAFYAQADAIISKEGESFLKKLPELSVEDCVNEFVQLIALGISGIFYYIGMLLQYLKAAKVYNGLIPNVYVGGNGSRLLHWLASGNFKKNSPINHLFKGILSKVSGLSNEQDFEINISPNPKSEVSCGLVTKDIFVDFNEDDIMEEFLAGEAFIYPNQKKGEWSEPLTTELIRGGLRTAAKLEQVEDFIKEFNAHSGKSGISPLEVDPILMGNIKDQVDDELAEFQRLEQNEIRIKSIFIIALKKLLEKKTNEWMQRHNNK